MNPDITRKFGGDLFCQNKNVRNAEKAHLKAYLAGKSHFKYKGQIIKVIQGYFKPKQNVV